MKTSRRFIPLLAVVGITLSACTPSGNQAIGLDTMPEIGDVIHFSESSVPEGWALVSTGGTGINEKVDAERPEPYTNGTCVFSRSVEYLPKGYAPRGDDYNTKEFISDMGASFKSDKAEIKSLSLKTEEGSLDALSSSVSYDDPNSGKSTTRFAVRVISEVKASGYEVENPPESPYAQNVGEGIPVIFLKADCIKGDTVTDEEWTALMDSTTVSLNSPVPTEGNATIPADSPFKPVPSPSVGPEEASPAPSGSVTPNPSIEK